MTKNLLAFSGGKDSTALALRMHELGEDFDLFFTPTGNELPELEQHIQLVERLLNKKAIRVTKNSLDWWIREYQALPNFRQRWCTRLLKIVPCIEYLKQHPGTTLIVGLRHDEEDREGLYGDYATYRYPMREWKWEIKDVFAYLKKKGVKVPTRTDCALCYYQRLGDWVALWKDHPEEFKKGIEYEELTGHTFRSARRDSFPASLKELAAEFEKGRRPRGFKDDLQLALDLEEGEQQCRVCRL